MTLFGVIAGDVHDFTSACPQGGPQGRPQGDIDDEHDGPGEQGRGGAGECLGMEKARHGLPGISATYLTVSIKVKEPASGTMKMPGVLVSTVNGRYRRNDQI